MKATRTEYALVLTPAAGNWRTPPLLRFKALLKAALRGYGLRAVSATETIAPAAPKPLAPKAPPAAAPGPCPGSPL
jgi:hypothetical protein